MKNLFLSFFAIISALFIFSSPVNAKVLIQENGTLTIPAGETIDDDLFVGSENFDFAGTVTGSMFVGSGIADIKGNIKGDLVLGTGKANLGGMIGGDLYLGAGDVNLVKVTVAGNVIIGAGNVSIDKDSKIGGSLITGAGSVRNSAPIGRNAVIGAGTLYLDNKVGKEARLGGGNIELGPLTAISGNLTYALGEDDSTLKQDPSATIAGSVTRYIPPANATKDMTKAKEDINKFTKLAKGGWLVISFLGSLLLGFLLIKLFPKTSLGLQGQVSKSLLSSLGIGFLVVMFAVPLFLVLALTIVGLPLVGLLIPLFYIELHLAKLISSYALGHLVAKQFNWNKMGVYGLFAIGLVLFIVLRAIPVFGWIISILFTWVGLGSIWLYIHTNLKNL